jgi:hypothetical protein
MHVFYKSWKTSCSPSSFLQLVPTHVRDCTHQINTHASFLIVLYDWNARMSLAYTQGAILRQWLFQAVRAPVASP